MARTIQYGRLVGLSVFIGLLITVIFFDDWVLQRWEHLRGVGTLLLQQASNSSLLSLVVHGNTSGGPTRPITDALVPIHHANIAAVHYYGMLQALHKHVVGIRTIWVLCLKDVWDELLQDILAIPNIKWLDESRFAHIPSLNVSKSYKLRAMALKLYVQMLIPEVADNLFHVDCDVFWLQRWDPWAGEDETGGKFCPSEAFCPKYVLSRTWDAARNNNFLTWTQALQRWRPPSFPDGCVPFESGTTAVNHHMLFQRHVIKAFHAHAGDICGAGEDSVARMMAGKTNFGCGLGEYWPAETQQYYMFLALYYPRQFIPVWANGIWSTSGCTPAAQAYHARLPEHYILMACHFEKGDREPKDPGPATSTGPNTWDNRTFPTDPGIQAQYDRILGSPPCSHTRDPG